MNVLLINCLSSGHSWLQAGAHHESVLCVCPWLNLNLLHRDVNMFQLFEDNLLFAFLLQHNINAFCYREWEQERVKQRGGG